MTLRPVAFKVRFYGPPVVTFYKTTYTEVYGVGGVNTQATVVFVAGLQP